MWNWENPSSKTEVVGTEVFFCDNKYQITFTGNQDLSVYTSFGRKGGRGKNLKLDVFAKFDWGPPELAIIFLQFAPLLGIGN